MHNSSKRYGIKRYGCGSALIRIVLESAAANTIQQASSITLGQDSQILSGRKPSISLILRNQHLLHLPTQ